MPRRIASTSAIHDEQRRLGSSGEFHQQSQEQTLALHRYHRARRRLGILCARSCSGNRGACALDATGGTRDFRPDRSPNLLEGSRLHGVSPRVRRLETPLGSTRLNKDLITRVEYRILEPYLVRPIEARYYSISLWSSARRLADIGVDGAVVVRFMSWFDASKSILKVYR